MKNSYVINGYPFETKTALETAVKTILHSYYPGDELDARDADFLHDVLQMHPHAADKIGVGIQGFKVIIDHAHKTRCFAVIRTDGTSTDFSYVKCLRPTTQYGLVLKAMRDAIAPGIIEYRRLYFAHNPAPVLCQLSGKEITMQTCHIDHEVPHTFRRLADGFLRVKGYAIDGILDYELLALKTGQDNNTIAEFADGRITKRLVAFHWEYADLRVIDRDEHRRLGRGEDLLHTRPLTPLDIEKREEIRREMAALGYVLNSKPSCLS